MKKIPIISFTSFVVVISILFAIRTYNIHQKALYPHLIDGTPIYKSTTELKQHGSSVELTLAKLKASSDLVLRGKVISVEIKPFNNIPNVPVNDRESLIYKKGSYQDISFKVDKYFKGQGNEVISIRRPITTPELGIETDTPSFKVGDERIVYLFKGESIYAGGYLTQGAQGVATLQNAKVTFASGKEYSFENFLRSFQ